MLPSDQVRVLLVDDNEGMLARAARVIAERCTVVGSASDGASALDVAARLEPDVIVLDISMRGVTGLDVARILRARGSRASIVFLTVHDEDEFVVAAQATGALGYVLKARLATDLVTAVLEARAGRSFVSATFRAPAGTPRRQPSPTPSGRY